MTKYIDAEKLIAEIERHINHYESSNRDDFKNGELYICQELLSFIKSLQQEKQEVDLEEVVMIDNVIMNMTAEGYNNGYKTRPFYEEVLRRFNKAKEARK